MLQTELRYDQPWAMAALIYIDARLGSNHAAVYLGSRGLWERFAAGTPEWSIDKISTTFNEAMSFCDHWFVLAQ